MHMPAGPLGEPIADQLGLVRSVIVHHRMDVEVSGDVALDFVEESAELLGAMTAHALADDGPDFDVERGEERGGPVSCVVVRAPFGLAWPHRQERLGSIERLNLALFIDAENHRALGRRQIKPDDVAQFLHEQGVGRELEAFRPMRLQAEAAPDPMDRGRRMAHGFGHGPQAPVGRAFRPCLQRVAEGGGDLVVADLTRRAGTRLVVKPVQAVAREALAPNAYRVGANLELGRDFFVGQPARRDKNDARSNRQRLRRAVFAGQSRQRFPLGVA